MTMRKDGKKALTAAGWTSSPGRNSRGSPPANGGLKMVMGVLKVRCTGKNRFWIPWSVTLMKHLFDKKSENALFLRFVKGLGNTMSLVRKEHCRFRTA